MAPEVKSSVKDRSIEVSSGRVNSGARSPAFITWWVLQCDIVAQERPRQVILWHEAALLLIFRALLRGSSSVGRASRSQCEGRGFDPLLLHHLKRPVVRLRPLLSCLGSSVDRASAS